MKKNVLHHTENFKSKLKRRAFNLFPAYRRTGGRVIYLSDDWYEIRVRLKLNIATRNYVGTVFGGSLFGALDPIFMVQFINILGPKYVVWDKEAKIKFIRPVNKTVFAHFLIEEHFVKQIKIEIENNNETEQLMTVCFKDIEGKIYAEVEKRLYFADKAYYQSKRDKKMLLK